VQKTTLETALKKIMLLKNLKKLSEDFTNNVFISQAA
jgi:hypothetical protein